MVTEFSPSSVTTSTASNRLVCPKPTDVAWEVFGADVSTPLRSRCLSVWENLVLNFLIGWQVYRPSLTLGFRYHGLGVGRDRIALPG